MIGFNNNNKSTGINTITPVEGSPENKIKSIVKVKEDEKVASKINQEFTKTNEVLQKNDEKERHLRELANMFWGVY